MDIQEVIKTDDVIKVGPDDTLASALNVLGSSHDSAFVFEDDEFLGIVNPYHALIKKSYPSNTKVRNGLMHPPKITFSHKVEHAAEMMVESKIHYLPVFSGRDFAGILSARRIMRSILDSDQLSVPISQILKSRKEVYTILDTEFVTKALTKFKEKKISKLIVVDKEGKLAGMLTYYDIIKFMTLPRKRQSNDSRQGKKNAMLKKPVKNFYQSRVLTLTPKDSLFKAAKLILDKEIGSVVIVDINKKPVGIVTTRDILLTYTKTKKPSLTHLQGKNLSKASQATAEAFVKGLNTMLGKENNVKKAEVMIMEKKKGGIFEAVISVFRTGHKTRIFRGEDTNLRSVLQDVRDKTKRVIRGK